MGFKSNRSIAFKNKRINRKGAPFMEESTPEPATIDFTGFITALTESITVSEVLAVLASVVGVGMMFFLMWLGVRKATRAFTSAVSSGRIRI